MRSIRTLSSSRHGQSVVEMALLLPVFILCTLGMVDLGRAVYAEIALTEAVREGCRDAIVSPTVNSNAQVIQSVQQAAVGITVLAGNVTISGSRTSGSTVTISASYTFVPITPLIQQFAGSSLQLRASSVMIVD